jgi:hypothetical protein
MNKFKISLLVVVLVAVIFIIFRLKTSGLSESATGLLAAGDLSWCKTRVKAVSNSLENIAIEQQGMEWKASKPSEKALPPTFMEKWLGANCTLKIDSYVSKYVLPGGQTELIVKFIDGGETRFVRTEPGTFIHQGDVFKSSQFEEAWHLLNQAAR